MAVGTYALTTLSNLKGWMGITSTANDVELEQSIDRATAMIERYCDRIFVARTIREFIDPRGERTVTTRQRPIVSINSIAYGASPAFEVQTDTPTTDVVATVSVASDRIRLHRVASSGTSSTTELEFSTYATASSLVTQINSSVAGWNATLTEDCYAYQLFPTGGNGTTDSAAYLHFAKNDAQEYRVDYATGQIHLLIERLPYHYSDRGPRFPSSFFSVFVEYVAGYSSVPADVEQACIEMASDLYRERLADRTMQSESLGDYSYTRANTADVIARSSHLLNAYRSIR